MARRFNHPHSTIIVAVQLDLIGQTLIQCACDLARRGNFSVRAVHVIEPATFGPWSHGGFDIMQALEFMSVQHRDLMERRLADFVKRASPDYPVDAKVLSGNPSQMLAAESMISNVVCVITGAAARSHRFVPRGFSTALALMSTCPVPVIVLSSEAILNAKNNSFRMLVADDLRETSSETIRVAMEFASLFPDAQVEQVHVNTLTEETLTDALTAANSAARTAAPGDATVQKVFDGLVGDLKTRLEGRANAAQKAIMGATPKLNISVRTGPILSELESAVQSANPDLIVYGRHHTFHQKPFTIGQVPYYSVLAQQMPVMVVPTAVP